jgi:hypothetical protein
MASDFRILLHDFSARVLSRAADASPPACTLFNLCFFLLLSYKISVTDESRISFFLYFYYNCRVTAIRRQLDAVGTILLVILLSTPTVPPKRKRH